MVLRRYHLVLVLATILAPVPGPAQNEPQEPEFRIQVDVNGTAIPRNKGDWVELRSKNFLVAGDASDKDIRTAASELELFRSQIALVLPRAREPSTIPTRVVVFRDARSRDQSGPIAEGALRTGGGYLRPGSDFNYIVLSGGEKLSQNLIRDYVRTMLKDSMTPAPPWLAEGLVEYFGTYKLDRLGDDRVIKFGLDEYKGNVNDKKLIPLETLFRIDRTTFDKLDEDSKKDFDAESGALFQYLSDSHRLSAAARFGNAMTQGQAMPDAFRDAFKIGVSTFEENFKRSIYVNRTYGWSVNFFGFTLDRGKKLLSIFYAKNGVVRLPPSFDEVGADIRTRAVRILPEAEAQFHLGDLLLHNNRIEEAEVDLRNSIEMNPRYAAAHASLGMAYLTQGNYDLARESLDRAVALDSNNYFACYYGALLTVKKALKTGPLTVSETEDLVASLMKAVRLAPEFIAASELLAEIQRSLGDLQASSKTLIAALTHSPGRQSLSLELAQVAAQGGDKPSAGWLLQSVIAGGAADAVMLRAAQERLVQLGLSQQERKAFGKFSSDAIENAGSPGVSGRVSLAQSKAGNKKPDGQEKIVRGILIKVDCTKGLTLSILTGTPPLPQEAPFLADQHIEYVHSDMPQNIDWVTDTGVVADPVACGPADRIIAITYKPQRKGQMLGEPLIVEFLLLPDPGYSELRGRPIQ